VDAVVAELAARQHGVIARRQLDELGLRRGAIWLRRRNGRIHPVHHGVYAVGHSRLTMRGRWMAAVLAHGPEAVLSHISAAALWNLVRPRGGPSHVMREGSRVSRHAGIVLHRSAALSDADRVRVDGIPVTALPRTLLDLASVLDGASLARAFEEADRLRLLELRSLNDLRDRSPRHRGIAAFRRALGSHIQPPDVRSELERMFLELVAEAGLPTPSLNVLVAGHLVDCLWAGARLVVELDGFAFHRTRAAHDRDHERDVDLALAGYEVRRFTYPQVETGPRRWPRRSGGRSA
jgi:Protein of unknown function (DUF559)/Transcriptional regulator, AbiEi antitoxin